MEWPNRLFHQVLDSGIISLFNTPSNAVNKIVAPVTACSFAAVAGVLAVCLAGCSRDKASPVQTAASKKPVAAVMAAPLHAEPAIEAPAVDKSRAAELMQAIFGDNYHADDSSALLVIEDGEDAGNWSMTLHAAKELADGRTVVVVNGAPADENGKDASAHASAGMLSVYTLRRAQDTWQVVERHDDVGTMGSNGNIGVVKWIDLGEGRPGIVVSSGGTWFGSTIMGAEVYDLDHAMRSLGGFAELSSNAGGCMPETKDCWDVDGKIGTVPAAHPGEYRDILVDFAGKHFRVTESANGDLVEHLTRKVSQTARYRFNGKTYVLVSGENPVPGIEG
jgi:hypothetical protein